MEHPISGLMQTAMSNIREMVDVNTIIGDPIEAPDGTVILPVSRVGFGFAAGGSEFEMSDGCTVIFWSRDAPIWRRFWWRCIHSTDRVFDCSRRQCSIVVYR